MMCLDVITLETDVFIRVGETTNLTLETLHCFHFPRKLLVSFDTFVYPYFCSILKQNLIILLVDDIRRRTFLQVEFPID